MPIQKAGKLSPKTSSQGYRCEQREFVLLLPMSFVTVNTFSGFLSFPASLNLFLLLRQIFVPHFSTLLLRTGSFSCVIFFFFFCLIHYFACPFLPTSFCPPSVYFSLHHLSLSPSPRLFHPNFSVYLYSIACHEWLCI